MLTGRVISGVVKLTSSSDVVTPVTGAETAKPQYTLHLLELHSNV